MSLAPPLTLHQHLPVHNAYHSHLHSHCIIAYLSTTRVTHISTHTPPALTCPQHVSLTSPLTLHHSLPALNTCHSHINSHSTSTYLPTTCVTHTSTYTPSALICPQHVSLTPPLILHLSLPALNTCHSHLHSHSTSTYLPTTCVTHTSTYTPSALICPQHVSLTPPLILHLSLPALNTCHSHLHSHSTSTYLPTTCVTHTSTHTPSALICPQHVSLTPPLILHLSLPALNTCHSHLHSHSISTYLPSTRVTHTFTHTPSALTYPQHVSLTPPLTPLQHLSAHSMCHSHLHSPRLSMTTSIFVFNFVMK